MLLTSEKVARLAGLEPTASASAGLRSIQTELQARVTHGRFRPQFVQPVVVPRERFELSRPLGALRPERSASAVPPPRLDVVDSTVRCALSIMARCAATRGMRPQAVTKLDGLSCRLLEQRGQPLQPGPRVCAKAHSQEASPALDQRARVARRLRGDQLAK